VDGDDRLVANPAQTLAGKKKRVKGTFWPWPVIPSDMPARHPDLRTRRSGGARGEVRLGGAGGRVEFDNETLSCHGICEVPVSLRNTMGLHGLSSSLFLV